MNRLSSDLISIVSLIVVGAIVLSGCGLRDFNDPISEPTRDLGIDNAENRVPDPEGMPPPSARQSAFSQSAEQGMPAAPEGMPPPSARQSAFSQSTEQGMPAAPEGMPPPSAGPRAQSAQDMPTPSGGGSGSQPQDGGGCPAAQPQRRVVQAPARVAPPPPPPVTELPPAFVREPDLVNPLPTNVVNTNEVRPVNRVVEHYREILQPQERLRIHNVHQPYSETHRYRQKIINIPSSRTIITATSSASYFQEMLPTEVETLPNVDYGAVFVGWYLQ